MMADIALDRQTYPMTVVIATLGGDVLGDTIEKLNEGSIVPREILICIPAKEAPRVQHLACANVRILVTECRGQVAQRIEGFKNATHDIVMQMDDDMAVERHCIEYLLETLNSCGPMVAVAPALINQSTGESTYKKPSGNAAISKIYYWLMNGAEGYQPGWISKAGTPIGVDPAAEGGTLFDVEWLAGGCVIHYRENLVLENFYPFKGKAYYEDIIHSHHLRSKGVSLKVDARARCWLESVSPSSCGHMEFLKYLVADYRARKYFFWLGSRESVRIYLYYLATYLNYLRRRVIGLRVK